MANNRIRRGRGRGEEIRDEFEQEIIDLARVTRVMAGGKRMRFRACVALGDRKGRVGLGLAKGADVSIAISKATNEARKSLVKVEITPAGSIPHSVKLKFNAAKILLKPAPIGTGVMAGSVLRQVLSLAGVRDVSAKTLGSASKINNAKAAIMALSSLRPTKQFKSKKDLKQDL